MKKDRPASVLIVDDEPEYAELVSTMLGKGYRSHISNSGSDALELLKTRRFDFVLCDVQMPEMSGLALLNHVREQVPTEQTFVMMSAFGTLDTVMECLKSGAYDYISKPFKKDEIRLTLAKAVERERLRGRVHELEAALQETFHFENIIARSPAMHKVFELLRKVADYRTMVLIEGESGTGKELVARALHYSSNRCDSAFVAVNCGAIPENLLESELFGYVKGAFTDASRDKRGLVEEADGGTLFLDEVGELPLSLQVKLLRVLQEQEIRRVGSAQPVSVDIRVVAATVRDLEEEVREGRFREDLFYRLNVIPLRLPALRERPEDIPILAQHFVEKINQRHGTSAEGFTPAALRVLVAYDWPGNVRELENLIERLILLSDQAIIGREALPESLVERSDPTRSTVLDGEYSVKKAIRRVEEVLIAKALAHTGGNRSKAAKLLEISNRALLYKIKDYGIDV